MAQIQKGTTYITGDQVTAANLNALADSAILLAGAITDQTAKTVPLAADTVLIHSAADTALRKSTLTQVFANATGIPISTGISGLGTGIATALAVNVGTAGAPVVNGGALGTPSSGTVTNLTGTASININGTVGATTPSTVAATTISATTGLSIGATQPAWVSSRKVISLGLGANINGSTGLAPFAEIGANVYVNSTPSNIYLTTGVATNYRQVNGSHVFQTVASGTAGNVITFTDSATITLTGLNSTAIGATTPSTGAFTTLSTNSSNGVTTLESPGISSVGLQFRTNSNNRFKIETPSASADLAFYSAGTTEVARLSSTGLAVTGALSTTGNVTLGGGADFFNGSVRISDSASSTAPAYFQSGEPGISGSNVILSNNYFGTSGGASGRKNTSVGASFIRLNVGSASTSNTTLGFISASGTGTDVATFSSTGLAVTGAVSSTGNVDFGTTASSPRITLGQVTNAVADNSIILRTGSTKTAWLIGAQFSQDNGLEITPSTTAGGTTFSTPKLVVNSTGLAVTGDASATAQVVSGAVGATGSAWFRAGSTLAVKSGIDISDSSDTSSAVFAAWRNGSGSVIGSISRVTTTNAVAYNTTSDGRLKENLRDFTDSGRLIDSLKPRVFDWKNSDENGKNVVGFVAQEQHAADPIFAHIGAVTVGDEDSETITKQWQRSDSALIPILVAELKSLRARLAALESK